MQHRRPMIEITCPFCHGTKMFHERSPVDPVHLSGSPVICYLCRGRGKIKAHSERYPDIQEAISEIEQERRIRSDLADFHAQRS